MKTGIPAYTSEAWDSEVMPRVQHGEFFDITSQLPPKKSVMQHETFAGVVINVKTEQLFECIGYISLVDQKGYVNVREVPVEEIEALLPEGETLTVAVPVPEGIEKPKV